MTRERVLALLRQVAAGQTSAEEALRHLAFAPLETIDFATIDHHRSLRQGYPEVVFGEGKTPGQVVAIVEHIAARGDGFLVTRADPLTREALAIRFPAARLNERARTVWLPGAHAVARSPGVVVIASAGTSDEPVAEEAHETAAALSLEVRRIKDVGVAGLHRLLVHSDLLSSARVTIVVAGMDGALPSVVGGLVSSPVVAVPTSVGYGASLGGLAALFTMLNSCAAGITVVNIDNGFGAAMAAWRIAAADRAGVSVLPSDANEPSV